jgi:hypothetical protein
MNEAMVVAVGGDSTDLLPKIEDGWLLLELLDTLSICFFLA